MADGRQMSSQKGPDLEEALKAYFSRAGYFALRGVPFNVDGDEVTDIDLWLYERPAALTRRRIIVDAKNRKSPRAGERIVWASGLKSALSADGAIVATTDKRNSIRSLAEKLGISLLDGEAVARIVGSKVAKSGQDHSSDQLTTFMKEMDAASRTSNWRTHLDQAKSSVLQSLGPHSANMALIASGFYAEQLATAPANSRTSEIALRALFFCSALAGIGLDFMTSTMIFLQPEERKKRIVDAIRFGSVRNFDALSAVTTAIALARKHADNGPAVAKQIEYGFYQEADLIPAEIIAEYIDRTLQTESLFLAAKELEAASLRISLPGYDSLSIEAKSMLGAFLDFNGVSREKVASSWLPASPSVKRAWSQQSDRSSSANNTLFGIQDKKKE